MSDVNDSMQNKADMASARRRSRLDVESVRNQIYGHEIWSEHNRLAFLLARDPAFDKSQIFHMTRGEWYKRALRMTEKLTELSQIHSWSSREFSTAVSLVGEPMPLDLNEIAFAPVFLAQASPELLAKYRSLVINKGILGCYLQTELGHGSNVASLETTATYIPQTQEIEIHSPTLTSRKWWIGALARTSTHGVVQARLILPGGKDLGPHLFFVQLRSMDDHRVLPGITLGDIGPKVMNGYAATDNGYAVFDRVRIPRENMLSRFAQVTPTGEYIKPPHAKMSYGGMVYIRSTIVPNSGWTIAKAITIAVRYATVRRQGGKGEDNLERQIITYPSVYYRLLPIISHAYVFILLGRSLIHAFDVMSRQLAAGNASLLAEMHATTSGLKALSTRVSVQDVETARRALGGHGYSAFSGLGNIYADKLPSVTYEGDNYVLDQQVVRAAVKAYKNYKNLKLPSESALTPSTAYLRKLPALKSGKPGFQADEVNWNSSSDFVDLLEKRAALMVQNYAETPEFDANAAHRVSCAVTEAFVALQVGTYIPELFKSFDTRTAQIMNNLLNLYLLSTIETALVDFLSFGFFSSGLGSNLRDATTPVRVALNNLCANLLPEAIGLTDAFGFSNWELESALGVYDGNVYEALVERAAADPLNKSTGDVPDGYVEYLRPLMERGRKLAASQGAKL
ncbi:peroxisomal oxidase [Panus rudis PR-1116 ss-1]|nr:peroxisomal oxidase [Panus rudis PR-1116 ss-1]